MIKDRRDDARLDALKRAFLENAARRSAERPGGPEAMAPIESLAAAAMAGRREAGVQKSQKNKPR